MKRIERLQILRDYAQGARILALQEPAILIGLGLAVGGLAGLVQDVIRLSPVRTFRGPDQLIDASSSTLRPARTRSTNSSGSKATPTGFLSVAERRRILAFPSAAIVKLSTRSSTWLWSGSW